MGVKKLDELVAFRLAREFKLEVYRIANASQSTTTDLKFRSQLFESASGVEACIGEGFHRFTAGEFRQFLRYALASVAEAKLRLQDGVDRGQLTNDDCQAALTLGNRCAAATMNLYKSLERFAGQRSVGKQHGANSPKSRRRSGTFEP